MKEFVFNFPDDDDDDLGGELIEAKNSRELNEFIYLLFSLTKTFIDAYAKTVLNYKTKERKK